MAKREKVLIGIDTLVDLCNRLSQAEDRLKSGKERWGYSLALNRKRGEEIDRLVAELAAAKDALGQALRCQAELRERVEQAEARQSQVDQDWAGKCRQLAEAESKLAWAELRDTARAKEARCFREALRYIWEEDGHSKAGDALAQFPE